jgi:hypothetical protein
MLSQFQSFYKSIGNLCFLGLLALVINCKGPQGDPGPAGSSGKDGVNGTNGQAGPQGEQGLQGPQGLAGVSADELVKNGFIKGTIKGTRTDGTPFTENFDYTIQFESQGFEKVNDQLHQLELSRSEAFGSGNNSHITLLVTNKGLPSQQVNIGVSTAGIDYNGFFLFFEKMLSGNTMFYLRTNALFAQSSIFRRVSSTNNATYKFADYGNNFISASLADADYYVTTEDGSKVYFDYIVGSNTYKFVYIIDNKGVKSVTSAIYGDLVYKYDSQQSKYKLYKASTDLSEMVSVPADTQEVTNFNYDPASGQISFEYKINIQALRSQNTTKHAIEIIGTVNAKIYDSKIMRMSQE